MSDSNRYGRIVTDGMVEKAVVASLQVWLDDYLGEVERIDGYAPGSIERPHAIVTSSEFDKMPEVQIPCVLVVNAGPQPRPLRLANGRYDAKYTMGIAAIVSDIDGQATRDLCMAYVAAIRAALGQHKMLKSPLHPAGFANSSLWLGGDSYADLPFADSRSMLSGRVVFQVGVDNVFTEQAGPRIPSPSPQVDPGPWPSATSVTVNKQLVGSLP